MYRKLYILILCLGVLRLGGCGGEFAGISGDGAVSGERSPVVRCREKRSADRR